MSLAADGLPPLRDVVAAHGLEPRKALGQNFLFDLNLTRKIARAAGPLAGVAVVEVGPGPGGLTRALLSEGAEKVIAIERDGRALGALGEIAAHWPGRLDIIEGDALSVAPRTLVEKAAGMPLRIVANLPYNIATALLGGWLEAEPWPPCYDRLILMIMDVSGCWRDGERKRAYSSTFRPLPSFPRRRSSRAWWSSFPGRARARATPRRCRR
jgi:16S rRNA (adenine1518-N6/adenine1519-N6)-dimethyltransferase